MWKLQGLLLNSGVVGNSSEVLFRLSLALGVLTTETY